MTKRDEMREALDQLKMLTGEGIFENKEAPWSRAKVAPDQQQQDTRVEALSDLSAKLHEKDQRLKKREEGLQEREERLRVEKVMFQRERAAALQEETAKIKQEYARIQKEDTVLFVERNRLETWKMALDREKKDGEFRSQAIHQREERLQAKEEKYRERKELTQSLELARRSVEEEKKQSAEWRKMKEYMDEAAKDTALYGLQLFVRMWKDAILAMIRQDKLRCIIPRDTTTWFNANYYKLDSARQTSLGLWMSDYLDVKIRDLRIDIDTQTPRFVIFYRQSKLEKHAAESWEGNTQNALKNMHCIQEDDWDKVDENLAAIDRRRVA